MNKDIRAEGGSATLQGAAHKEHPPEDTSYLGEQPAGFRLISGAWVKCQCDSLDEARHLRRMKALGRGKVLVPHSRARWGRVSSRDFPCGRLSTSLERPREEAAQGRAQSLRRGDRKHTERRG